MNTKVHVAVHSLNVQLFSGCNGGCLFLRRSTISVDLEVVLLALVYKGLVSSLYSLSSLSVIRPVGEVCSVDVEEEQRQNRSLQGPCTADDPV